MSRRPASLASVSPRRTELAAPFVLGGLVACAQLVGLDELREEQRELQAAARGATSDAGLPPASPPRPSASGVTGSSGAGGSGPGSAPSGAMDDGSSSSPAATDGSAGSGSPEGSSGAGGASGDEAAAQTPSPADGQGLAGAGQGSACVVDADCRDIPPCTIAACRQGACVAAGFAAAGSPCGSSVDDECTNPDTCDGQGSCQQNDAIGTVCVGGTCAGGLCIAVPTGCVVDNVASLPFNSSWSSVGRPDLYDGGCDTEGTPDYALVFTAPQNGVFRVTSAALVDAVPYTGPGEPSGIPDGPADGDSVMTVVRGACAGVDAQQLECNDDVAPGTLGSQLDLALSAGEVVTVHLNELAQTGGGSGTVSIVALP